MQYPRNTQIKDIQDKVVIESPVDGPLTFGKLVITALLMPENPMLGQPPATPDEKVRRFTIAQRVERAKDTFELSIEEAALVKRLVGAFPATYVARCFEILDNPQPTVKAVDEAQG